MPPAVFHRRVLMTGTVVNGLPMALDSPSVSGAAQRPSPSASGAPAKREEFVVGPSPSRAALAAADGASEEARQRSKEYARRMQHDVLKKTALAVVDGLLAKHSRLRFARRCSLRDSLEDIRAEEADLRAAIAAQKARRVAQLTYLEGLGAQDVAGAVSRALDIVARQPSWVNEPFFHLRCAAGAANCMLRAACCVLRAACCVLRATC
jgi:hypothetical protein